MKVHYINILLFALPLNILENSPQKNPSITERHTQNNRSLCECELYAPANYDCDPQMKEVMENFSKQTQQRFEEYDNRMIEKRKQCKDKCDKEIQKIILKDKLEKQMAQQLTTLETTIDTNDIPTCVCEKSMADKVEKSCLRCGGLLGGGVAPSVGLLGGIGICGWKMGVPAAAAEAAAKVEAAFAAIEEGVKTTLEGLEYVNGLNTLLGENIKDLVTPKNFYCEKAIVAAVKNVKDTQCVGPDANTKLFCNAFKNQQASTIYEKAAGAASEGFEAYKTEFASQKALLEARYTAAVDTAYASYQTAIIASIVAIVVIVLIMVIIYLILHYRRKKKMKKKLQYIKLLNE
ncbi:rifin PIR protein, putative [Plasmodium reichenowi]|uniref:Rifin PIR protein, putative n=1 Tax=Plasmodium reichenowi TaxID=5854 RepID=A0A2P9D3Y6_PLARE|nr:rifin PIR protein, putative [Plasmodium reichenowi]